MGRVRGFVPIAVCGVILLAGCSVEREREAQIPDVDVDVDGGRWPEYDVRWADVDIGTEQRTIKVPEVTVNRVAREVTVPFIRINPPGGGQTDERTVSLAVDVPHPGYELQIVEVRASGDDLWVIGTLRETDAGKAQAMTRLDDHVVIQAPEGLDVRKVLVGQRPEGVSRGEFRFVDSMGTLEEQLPADARTLYRRSGAVG